MKASVKKASGPGLTEPEAIRLAQDGDPAGFEYLYKFHSRRVYSICMRILKNTSDAEDLTQQVFLRLFRKIGTFRGDSGFSTWLHRVTVNAVLMHLRRRKQIEIPTFSSDRARVDGDEPREFGSGDPSMLGAIERLNLMRAIHQLPFGYKRFFLLHHFIGFKHNEIARLLSCSVGCSKSQVHKARKRLQRLLRTGQTENTAASARDSAISEIGPQQHRDVTSRHLSSNTLELKIADLGS
jgi:RNA polymerase sigma-70 factor (ECF subfamily)